MNMFTAKNATPFDMLGIKNAPKAEFGVITFGKDSDTVFGKAKVNSDGTMEFIEFTAEFTSSEYNENLQTRFFVDHLVENYSEKPGFKIKKHRRLCIISYKIPKEKKQIIEEPTTQEESSPNVVNEEIDFVINPPVSVDDSKEKNQAVENLDSKENSSPKTTNEEISVVINPPIENSLLPDYLKVLANCFIESTISIDDMFDSLGVDDVGRKEYIKKTLGKDIIQKTESDIQQFQELFVGYEMNNDNNINEIMARFNITENTVRLIAARNRQQLTRRKEEISRQALSGCCNNRNM